MERIIDHRYRARIEFSANISNFIVHEAGKRVWDVSSRNITRQLRFAFPAHQIICYNIKQLCRSTISQSVTVVFFLGRAVETLLQRFLCVPSVLNGWPTFQLDAEHASLLECFHHSRERRDAREHAWSSTVRGYSESGTWMCCTYTPSLPWKIADVFQAKVGGKLQLSVLLTPM